MVRERERNGIMGDFGGCLILPSVACCPACLPRGVVGVWPRGKMEGAMEANTVTTATTSPPDFTNVYL